ncbi:MAG: hypothetical protein ACK4SX_11885 [Alcanivoracaceae bacterium]
MRFIVLLVAVFMCGCSAKVPVQSHDKIIKMSEENVMVSLNNLKVKPSAAASAAVARAAGTRTWAITPQAAAAKLPSM